ncbi:hypothetical protein M405DRAFT_846786 [Rhizopogon salebrosus TDB-379]|nr:hypothetical protein M405DRAFT_846786 [Rhizopogon salebrosus TDB-379]
MCPHKPHPLPRCRRSRRWMRDRTKNVYTVDASDIAEKAEQIVRVNGRENVIMVIRGESLCGHCSRRLPIRDERHSRETPMAVDARYGVAGGLQPLRIVGLSYLRQLFYTKFDLKVHGFKRISLPTEWLIIGDLTKAADFTKLWNDLRKSISFVEGVKSQSWTGHFWTHCR